MVDFRKRRASGLSEKPTRPSDIYSGLDRASDKGPLRRSQETILDRWYSDFRGSRDVIVKLHTGQGKTLVGLLMLQSKRNEKSGRALYLCPSKLLVSQTLAQAKQFGISAVSVDRDGSLPDAFLEGDSILVTTVHKLFNGKTKFGIDARSISVDYVVLDDAHACVDAIKRAFQISLRSDEDAYQRLINLFESDLQEQGAGSFAEIRLRSGEAGGPVLPVPYWAWQLKHQEVLKILADSSDTKSLAFVWPLLRDALKNCQCVVSSGEIVIAPYLPNIEAFGSFANSAHRVFMTATVSDDSFLVKGLGLAPEVVNCPLSDPSEGWSGEKMVLIPSLIAEDLDQGLITKEFAKPVRGRKGGLVVLTPSFASSEGWKAAGATVAARENIDAHVDALRSGSHETSVVIVNRYDGIDLPDDACRILVIDGKPFAESLLDVFEESCRPGSEVIAARVARTIEQGLGRAVRGERDYCAVLICGADLVKAIRARETKKHFSPQTLAQVEMGVENSELAREDVANGATPFAALNQLIRQCLGRDQDWKDFYVERMDSVETGTNRPKLLELFCAELKAEREHLSGNHERAVETIQALLDKHPMSESERGWYLQHMARYKHSSSVAEAAKLQQAAHVKNRLLLKSAHTPVRKLTVHSQRRSEAISRRLREFGTYEELDLFVGELSSLLKFGVKADAFERAWNDLGGLLGFGAERPDKEWKEGPDNLWVVKQGDYILVECKNEVELTRVSINKQESGQLNNACAWFAREYPGCTSLNIMIAPTSLLSSAAGFNEPVRIMRKAELGRLVARVRSFFKEFALMDLSDLSEQRIGELLALHKLEVATFGDEYTVAVRTQ